MAFSQYCCGLLEKFRNLYTAELLHEGYYDYIQLFNDVQRIEFCIICQTRRIMKKIHFSCNSL